MRHNVRTIASRLMNASYGKQTRPNNDWRILLEVRPTVLFICCVKPISFGFHIALQSEVSADGTNIIAAMAKVKIHGLGNRIQPINNKTTCVMGVTLRLRLSKIFHLDNAEIGFPLDRPSGPGTNGKNQFPICQSPRIHLCLLLISV